MTESIDSKESRLFDYIRRFKSVLVAYSGGLDSAMVLWASIWALGAENVYAATAESPSFASGEADDSRKFAAEIGLSKERHLFLATDELNDPNYRSNPTNRCYFCKSELFSKLKAVARENNIDIIFDGSNLSDSGDFRPGRQAGLEMGIVSPLLEAEMTKDELRLLARKYNLSFSEKAAAACLASRIPYGTEVTSERLKQIDKAEKAVRRLGFDGFRVRYHNEVARLELRPEDISRALETDTKQKIISGIKKAGFKFVAVDLEGYCSGSLNRMIPAGERVDE